MSVSSINANALGNTYGFGPAPGQTNRLGNPNQVDAQTLMAAAMAAEFRKFLTQNPQMVLGYLQQANPYLFQMYAPNNFLQFSGDPLALAEMVLFGRARDKKTTTKTSVDFVPHCGGGGHGVGAPHGASSRPGVRGPDSTSGNRPEVSGAWAKHPKTGKDVFVPQPPNREPGPGSGRGVWVNENGQLAWAKSNQISEGRWTRNKNGKLEWRPPKDLEDAFKAQKPEKVEKEKSSAKSDKADKSEKAEKSGKTEKSAESGNSKDKSNDSNSNSNSNASASSSASA